MSRKIERAAARRQYDRFSRDWRREKRMAGAWGRPGGKPRFSEWYHMHDGVLDDLAASTPGDVREHLGLPPWARGLRLPVLTPSAIPEALPGVDPWADVDAGPLGNVGPIEDAILAAIDTDATWTPGHSEEA